MAKKKQSTIVSADAGSRQDRIKMALAQVEQQFGAGVVQVLGDAKPVPIPRYHSGSHLLNDLLGGGMPKGRIVEIYGPESSGKTTIALHAIAEVQKAGGSVLFIDAEHALDINYAQALGVNTKELILAQPNTGEEALQIAEFFIKAGAIDAFVIDSVASLVTKAELEGDIGDAHVGQLARLMSGSLKKLAGLIYKSGVLAIFINQIREKVGVMFGNPETTSGGRALKFYASVRLDVRQTGKVNTKDDNPFSRVTKITIVKSKVSVPHRSVEVDIEFGKGISRSGEIIDLGVELGLISKSGNWYMYDDTKQNGRENMKVFLESNPEIMDMLDDTIGSMLFTPEAEGEEPELGDVPEEETVEGDA